MPPLQIVILAAGQGTRMYSDLPKVLHCLAGKPLLQHVIDTVKTLNPQKLVVVYGHGGDKVQATIQDPEIIWAHQTQQRGTGDAVKAAIPYLDNKGQILVLYGDVPLIAAETLSNLLTISGNHVGLLTDVVPNASGYGRIVRDDQQQFTCIVEEKDADAATRMIQEINTGIGVFPAEKLAGWLEQLQNSNAQQEYYLTDVFAMSVQEGIEVKTLQPAHSWEAEGINNKRQLATLERIYQAQYADRLLQQGVTILDPARIDIRGHLHCERDVTIDVNTVFEGEVTLKRGVRIGANCVLKNVTIEEGTEIAPFSHLEGAQVGAGSKIGPFARLRPGAELGDAVHIGNFVEVKKSRIANGAKVNHLTYIGDAIIGEKTNVGAGTVTCNYDGVNKYQTTIGKNVFIGSGSMLVAPVTIEDGATIGAGSTITKTAPAEKLTLERSKQITIEGWRRPVKK